MEGYNICFLAFNLIELSWYYRKEVSKLISFYKVRIGRKRFVGKFFKIEKMNYRSRRMIFEGKEDV